MNDRMVTGGSQMHKGSKSKGLFFISMSPVAVERRVLQSFHRVERGAFWTKEQHVRRYLGLTRQSTNSSRVHERSVRRAKSTKQRCWCHGARFRPRHCSLEMVFMLELEHSEINGPIHQENLWNQNCSQGAIMRPSWRDHPLISGS